MAQGVAEAGGDAVFSYAGRVAHPKPQPIPTRVGGFGGSAGLVAYLRAQQITHVVDATHPFAAQMSWNAYHACRETGVPLLALTRPVWSAQAGDSWTHVADVEGAIAALSGHARRVMLALGKQNVAAFVAQSQHHYVLRLVDQPDVTPPLPHHSVVVARGPFDVACDTALFTAENIDVVVCKNAGGSGAVAKLEAARALGLEVIMIARPELPPRAEAATSAAVLNWMRDSGADCHKATERGV